MIFDCFPFFNELDLLEIRLNTLSPYVDHFLIAESDKTFSGKDKPRYLEKNWDRFAKFHDKITIVNYSHQGEAWATEAEARNCLGRQVLKMSKNPRYDIVIQSDCDEVPNGLFFANPNGIGSPQSWAELNEWNIIPIAVSLDMRMFYYFLNTEKEQNWTCATVFQVRELENHTMQEMRRSDFPLIPNGGWHWSYLGGTEKIKEKIAAYSHQELNIPLHLNRIETMVNEGKDLFDRNEDVHLVSIDGTFPKWLCDNVNLYQHLIKQ